MKRILKSLRPNIAKPPPPAGRHPSRSGAADLTGRRASLDEEDDYNIDYEEDYVLEQKQQHYEPQPESVRHFQDESADHDEEDTLYTTTSDLLRREENSIAYGDATRQTPEVMNSYFVESPSSPQPSGPNTGSVHTSVTSTTSPSGKRVTTTTVRIPPPTGGSSLAPSSVSTIHAATAQLARCDETRHLVKQFIAAIWNRGELDIIPDVCSPSLRFNGNTGFDRVGHDGLARMVATIRDALDEYHCEIHSMVVEDNKAFCRLRFTGKHVGPLLGYAPTHQTVAWMGATEFTCQNGKILKVWELGDVKSLEEQLAAPLKQRDHVVE